MKLFLLSSSLLAASATYVPMPNGMQLDSSCIHQFDEHFRLSTTSGGDYKAVGSGGESVGAWDSACAFPPLPTSSENGDLSLPGSGPSSLEDVEDLGASYYSSWVAYAGHTEKKEYDLLSSTFVVPPAPHDYKRITSLFFFNGLQDQPSGGGATYILQPVLQYGKSGCGGGNYWSIAAFYVSGSGRAFCGKTYKVQEGDVINGNMTKSEEGDWTIVAEDVTSGVVSSYTAEQVTTPAIYGCITMEGIVVYNCGAFPNADEVLFYNNVAVAGGKDVGKVGWDVTVKKDECGQDVRLDSNGDVAILTPEHVKGGVEECLVGGLSAAEGGDAEAAIRGCGEAADVADGQCALQCTLGAIARYWDCALDCRSVECITVKCVADVIAFDIPCLDKC